MNMDPRTLTEYIRMQMMGGMSAFANDPYGSGQTEQSAGSSSDFMQLLQMMMQDNQMLATNAAAQPQLDPFGLSPAPNVKSASSLLQALQPLQAPFGVAPVTLYANSAVSSQAGQSAKQVSAPSATTSASSSASSLKGKASDYDAIIMDAAKKYGIEPSLIKAVIQAESNFRPNVVSRAGAKGLMQLMDGTAKALGVTNSFDPVQNINGGTKYIAQMIRRYDGDVSVALAAYNAGPGRVSRLGISNEAELQEKYHTLPKETQNYVKKVLAFKENY